MRFFLHRRGTAPSGGNDEKRVDVRTKILMPVNQAADPGLYKI